MLASVRFLTKKTAKQFFGQVIGFDGGNKKHFKKKKTTKDI